MVKNSIRRVLYMLRRSRRDIELREEMETHRALRQAALERDGLTPEDAERASRRAMGNVTLAVEDARDVWIVGAVDELWHDIRIALRVLRKSPGFAFAGIATLAISIGANTAIFSVVYAALLKPLPYEKPGELVAISLRIPTLQARFPTLTIRPIDFAAFRRSNTTFADLSAIRERNFNLTGRGDPERLYGARASANLFSMLGVQPALGRAFLPDEDTPGKDAVVVISHDLWARRFGGDPAIVNTTVSLDGQPHLVVGVMPSDFLFPTRKQLHPQLELGPRIDIWKPAAFSQDDMQDGLIGFSWGVIGRLKPGVSAGAARANLDAIATSISERMRAKEPTLSDFDLYTVLTPLRDIYFGSAHQGLVMLMVAVGLLLVIGCVNLVNLMLARVTSRSQELATRAALGAGRGRLIRQLLTESLVIAVLGGVAGVPIAAWSSQLLVWFGSSELSAAQATWLNASVLLFAVVVVFAVGLAVGVLPAIEMARGRLSDLGVDGSRAVISSPRSGVVRRALIVSEVAMCTALLVAAGLLLRSFVNVMSIDRGFEIERVLSLDLALPADRYQGTQRVAFYHDLLDSLRALPGITAAGAISVLPLTPASEGNTLLIHLDTDTQPSLDRPIAHSRAVTPGYFTAMGIPLLAGRLLDPGESPSNVVVSDSLARRLWSDASPVDVVGRRIKIQEVTDDPATIVGVVGDVRAARLDRDPFPAVYVPHTRSHSRAMTIVMRTPLGASTLAAVVRNEVWKRDNAIPVEPMRTMGDIVSESIAPRRFQTALVLLFAVLALGLALIGVYGVTSYAVTRRTREIGVRFALGAQRSQLMREVLSEHLRPVVGGLVLGLVLAWVASTSMRSLLFGVASLDGGVVAIVCVLLALTSALACYVPARRASQVDPVIALRQ